MRPISFSTPFPKVIISVLVELTRKIQRSPDVAETGIRAEGESPAIDPPDGLVAAYLADVWLEPTRWVRWVVLSVIASYCCQLEERTI